MTEAERRAIAERWTGECPELAFAPSIVHLRAQGSEDIARLLASLDAAERERDEARRDCAILAKSRWGGPGTEETP